MVTPFDEHANRANEDGYHNQRVNTHSDLVSLGIIRDLYQNCEALRADLDAGEVGFWINRPNPWGRKRNTDFLIARPLAGSIQAKKRPRILGQLGVAGIGAHPDPKAVRVIGEHKSIVTAHRNRSARHDDLDHLYQDGNAKSPNTILFATVMIGTAPWYLNVADGVKNFFARWDRDSQGRRRKKVIDEGRFAKEVIPRLRKNDEKLMDDYIAAVSENTERDIEASFELFCKGLPVRSNVSATSPGFDGLLVVPVHYDNINASRVDRNNEIAKRFTLDIDRDYQTLLTRICARYVRLYGK